MLCRQLDGHQRLCFAIQIVQEMGRDGKAVIRLLRHIDGEGLLARFAIFRGEEFDRIRIPAEMLEAQPAFVPYTRDSFGVSLCTPEPLS